MRILVTGGAGFIGSHIVDEFIERGHEVVIVDNLSTGKKENINPQAKFYQLDINSPELEQIFIKERPQIVDHHAAQIDVRRSVADPIYDAQINILGSINILELSRKYSVNKVIFASTGGAIYGEQDYFPADEQHPTNPISPYGIGKLTIEKYLFYYQQIHKLKYFILRYANVYGPRQDPHGEAGVVAIFAQKMLEDGIPVINGEGKQTRDYVYVGDVAKANLLSLDYPTSEIVNIGTGIETSVNELFNNLRKLIGKKITEKYGPAKSGEQQRSVLEVSKASRVLKWSPLINFEEGLGSTVEYFKEKYC